MVEILMDGRMEGTEGWKDGKMEGWKDGRMERWKDGKMERWKDGKMEGWKERKDGGTPPWLPIFLWETPKQKHFQFRK